MGAPEEQKTFIIPATSRILPNLLFLVGGLFLLISLVSWTSGENDISFTVTAAVFVALGLCTASLTPRWMQFRPDTLELNTLLGHQSVRYSQILTIGKGGRWLKIGFWRVLYIPESTEDHMIAKQLIRGSLGQLIKEGLRRYDNCVYRNLMQYELKSQLKLVVRLSVVALIPLSYAFGKESALAAILFSLSMILLIFSGLPLASSEFLSDGFVVDGKGIPYVSVKRIKVEPYEWTASLQIYQDGEEFQSFNFSKVEVVRILVHLQSVAPSIRYEDRNGNLVDLFILLGIDPSLLPRVPVDGPRQSESSNTDNEDSKMAEPQRH